MKKYRTLKGGGFLDATDSPSIRKMPSPVPAPKTFPTNPPTFTDRELRCFAWLVASLGWIPNAWANEIGSNARKLRDYLGDEALNESADKTSALGGSR